MGPAKAPGMIGQLHDGDVVVRGDRHHHAGWPHDDADGRQLRRIRARHDPRADKRRVGWKVALVGDGASSVTKRREIAESVISGRKSGAEMARLYDVSEPTVSRIVAEFRQREAHKALA